MILLLCPFPEGRVLEIGTGSGYQTAFLSKFFKEVFSVERIKALSDEAKKRLTLLGFRNIEYLISDGKMGWKEKSPFDRIIVTAAPETIVKSQV